MAWALPGSSRSHREERASGRLFHQPRLALLSRPAERSGRIAEQFALHELRRDGRAVHGYHGPAKIGAAVVDGAGDEFLARARGPFDQDRGVRADRDLGHGLHHVGQGLALGHEKGDLLAQGLFLQGADLLAQANGAFRPFQAEFERVHAQGFHEVVEGPALHGRDDRVQVLEGRDHYHGGMGREAANLVQHLKAAHVGQPDVQQHQVRGQGRQQFKGLLAPAQDETS